MKNAHLFLSVLDKAGTKDLHEGTLFPHSSFISAWRPHPCFIEAVACYLLFILACVHQTDDIVRYNLLSGNVCGPFWSFFFGVVFPWIVTAFCYEQDVLTTLCNWVAIICSGYINFVVPAMLYHTALSRYPDKACPWGELPDGQ